MVTLSCYSSFRESHVPFWFLQTLHTYSTQAKCITLNNNIFYFFKKKGKWLLETGFLFLCFVFPVSLYSPLSWKSYCRPVWPLTQSCFSSASRVQGLKLKACDTTPGLILFSLNRYTRRTFRYYKAIIRVTVYTYFMFVVVWCFA